MTTQRAILTCLERVGTLLPESTVLSDVRIITGNLSLPLTTLRGELGKLEDRRQIVAIPSADEVVRYKITDEGKARLAE